MALAPNRIVGPAERLAFTDPDVGRLRPWTLPIARLEGLLALWVLGRRSRSEGALAPLLAVLGAALALAPRAALRFGLRLAYENPADLEAKPWVAPATRLAGACYLAAGLFAGRAGGPTAASRDEGAEPRRA